MMMGDGCLTHLHIIEGIRHKQYLVTLRRAKLIPRTGVPVRLIDDHVVLELHHLHPVAQEEGDFVVMDRVQVLPVAAQRRGDGRGRGLYLGHAVPQRGRNTGNNELERHGAGDGDNHNGSRALFRR